MASGWTDDFTWQGLGPLHHGHQLSLPQLVEAGQQGLCAVWQGVIVTCIDQVGLDGLQDGEQGGAAVQGRRHVQGHRVVGC